MNAERVVEASVAEGIALPVPLAQVEAAVHFALESEGVREGELSIAFVGDAAISELNEQYLAHAGATDVISFALHPEGKAPLGDIYIGVDQARRQADELAIPLEEELLRLVLHGVLHVLGYDHPEGDNREGTEMYQRQEVLLSTFLDRIGPSGR